ncbi:hypothetical protein CEXT_437471 [Caerostris extrusa]|uniref:Uncharacterized protein n=1 Tax=Caerostris extrusa TaxID=172846 RepID=A0AAV4XXF1_CAEEX|nr:hypothetical protein CEXT_437471 [Caerostris extrusa]
MRRSLTSLISVRSVKTQPSDGMHLTLFPSPPTDYVGKKAIGSQTQNSLLGNRSAKLTIRTIIVGRGRVCFVKNTPQRTGHTFCWFIFVNTRPFRDRRVPTV